MAATTVMLQNFDKGLRSNWPPEQLTTIAKLSKIIESHPVPTFVNAMLVRLAESFKDGPNEIRVSIARSLAQCGSELCLAFSSAEIYRRILVVSHANDPDAREAVLDVLASLAQILPESSQAQHLICESLSTEHDGEFRAACSAMKSFAKLSSKFSESIVLQIGKILEDSNVSKLRKVHICDVFSTMRANAHTMEQIYLILDSFIKKTVSDDLLSAFLHSTTSLAIEIRYAIPKQIDTLINMLGSMTIDNSRASRSRMLAILRELKRLAIYSNIWNEKQIMKVIGCLKPTMVYSVIAKVFDVLIFLSKNCSQSNMILLKDFLVCNPTYGSMPDSEVNVRYIQLAANVFCTPRVLAMKTEMIETFLASLSIVIVSACSVGPLKKSLSNRLYKSIGDVLCAFPYNQFESSSLIISSLFTIIESLDITDENHEQRLEMMCRLVDTDRIYINDIHQWSNDVYERKRKLFNAYPKLFGYLCTAIGTSFPNKMSPVMFESGIAKYSTARSAFRNGKWKDVALPNLKAIDLMKTNKTTTDWILALRELAASEISELTLDSLDEQQTHLRSALSILKVSQSSSDSEMSRLLQFPIDFVSCMEQCSQAFSHLSSVITPFLEELSAAITPGRFFNPITAKRFVFALSTVEQSVIDAQNSISALCRTSFCADSTSLDLITQYYSRTTVLLTAIRVVLDKQSAETFIQLPPLCNSRTCTQFQQSRLQWTVDQIRFLKFDNVPNLKTVQTLHSIAEQLAVTPFMLPRFFFQQFYHVDIKITSTPQTEKSRPVNVQSTETIPIRIDGSVHSTHPSSIRSIVVYAEVNFLACPANNYVLTETVELNEKDYFTAQFLQNFKMSCEIKFRVEFIDSTCRKQWKTTSSTLLPISVRESTKLRDNAAHYMGKPL